LNILKQDRALLKPKKYYRHPFALLVASALLLLSCTTAVERLEDQAQQYGLKQELWKGTAFNHVVYRNGLQGDSLHVYLEGDGTPWLNRYWVAPDPTPRNPLALALMAQDNTASLYLGRPCYHGQAQVPPCNPSLWTSHRYGPEVLDSMAAVLSKILAAAPPTDLVLIGYSGGGALAMLLAERFEQVRAVVTIAGNLNPQRWAVWHHYSPLNGSLNPATRPSLPTHIGQWHFSGSRDRNVPPSIVKSFINQQHNAKWVVVETFDHQCCWQRIWPAILKQLQAKLFAK
jgi:hypothetical protein